MTVDFNFYVHITGTVEVDEAPDSPDDLLDAVFPDGWEGEVSGTSLDPSYLPKGYIHVNT